MNYAVVFQGVTGCWQPAQTSTHATNFVMHALKPNTGQVPAATPLLADQKGKLTDMQVSEQASTTWLKECSKHRPITKPLCMHARKELQDRATLQGFVQYKRQP